MFISKSMRALALTILLVPMASQADWTIQKAPNKYEYMGIYGLKGAAIGLLTFLGFVGSCNLINGPYPRGADEWGNAVYNSMLGMGFLGSLVGYSKYKKAQNECDQRQDAHVRTSFKTYLKKDDYMNFIHLNLKVLKRAFNYNSVNSVILPESPVTLAAQAGAEKIFDALIANGFKVTKEDYKILWDKKMADLHKKESELAQKTTPAYQSAIASSDATIKSIGQETAKRKVQEAQEAKERQAQYKALQAKRLQNLNRSSTYAFISSPR